MRILIANIRDGYDRIPTPIRAGWTTAWLTFVGVLLTIVTGLLPVLAEAISSGDFAPFYQSLTLAYSAALAAVSALAAGIVNAVYRWLRPIANSYHELGDRASTQ